MEPDWVARPSRRVSFVVAGVQKAGTTTLWEHLRRIPGLSLPERKELHFFDDERIDWSAPDLGAYHRAFAPAPPDALWGEATPSYLFWPQALERIRAYNPDMKLILIFRDPIERAISHWRMETARRRERRPLTVALRHGPDWPNSAAGPAQKLRRFSYVERGLYGLQLEKAMTLFPREQMLLLTSEALSTEAARTVERIARFLGVAPPPEVEDIRAFAGPAPATSPSPAELAALCKRFGPDLRRFAALSGLDLSGWPTFAALGATR